jgi:hypothetical protein
MNLSLQRGVTVPVYEVLWNRNDFNAVPVPALEKFRFRLRFGIQTIISTVFHRKKIVQNLAISMLGSSTVPMKLASHLVIVTFVPYSILCWIRIQIRFRNAFLCWNLGKFDLWNRITVPTKRPLRDVISELGTH